MTSATGPNTTGARKELRASRRRPPPETKHPAICAEIRRRICRGEVSGRLPSVRELAREFEVHSITAVKAVDALVSEGLVRSVPRKGYFVARRKVRSVALLIYSPGMGQGFYADLGRIIVQLLPRYHFGHELFLLGSGSSGDGFPAPAEISSRKGSAVLTVGIQDRDYLTSLMAAGLPVVALDYVPADRAITAVGVDGVAAGYEATRYLLEQGRRSIGYIGHRRARRIDADCLLLEAGYKMAVDEAGLEPRSFLLAGREPRHLWEAFQALGSGGAPLDALFNSNVFITEELRPRCEAEGIRVPEELTMLAFGSRYPDLPAIRIDQERYCQAALDLVAQLAASPGFAPRQVLVRPSLVEPGAAALQQEDHR
jgi:DNA-binding LacI/PurR family transcriptional regulator